MMDKVNSYLFSGGVDSGYWNKLDSVFTKFLKQENSVQIYYFKQLCQHWDLEKIAKKFIPFNWKRSAFENILERSAKLY